MSAYACAIVSACFVFMHVFLCMCVCEWHVHMCMYVYSCLKLQAGIQITVHM